MWMHIQIICLLKIVHILECNSNVIFKENKYNDSFLTETFIHVYMSLFISTFFCI